MPLEVDAVVLDCDGLLVETEPGWTRAETAIFAEHGFGFGAVEKQLLIGGTLEAGGAAMAGYFGKPGCGPALAERLAGLVWEELSAGAPALPGARDRDLVCRSRDHGPSDHPPSSTLVMGRAPVAAVIWRKSPPRGSDDPRDAD